MLQSTPMLSRQDSADTRACQRDDPARAWTRAGTVDTRSLIAAVARAYNDVYYLETDVTPTAILGPGRTPAVAWARHLCAYLLVEDGKLTNHAAAQALGRTDHTTVLNSRARIATALAGDAALTATLTRARAILAGTAPDSSARCRQSRPSLFAEATPAELAEYRYWRLRALRTEASQSGAPQGAALGYGVR